jgi:hypothetical protein
MTSIWSAGTNLVEEELALVERALAHLVERLATDDAGKVERNEGDPEAGLTPLRAHRAQHDERVGDHRAVGDPGRLLSGDHPLVAVPPGLGIEVDAAPGDPGQHHVGAVGGLGDRPAADQPSLGVLEIGDDGFLDQPLMADPGREGEGERSGPEGDHPVDRAPAELLQDDAALERREGHATQMRGHALLVQIHLLDLAPDVPVDRALGDRLLRAHRVEGHRRRAEDLRGEAVHLLLEGDVLVAETRT